MPSKSARFALHFLAAALLLAGLTAVRAQQPERLPLLAATEAEADAVDPRWRESLDAFAAADRAGAPKPGGVVFVGSSSIRLWEGLERQFEQEPTIVKRGFGGSRLADCARYVGRLVLPYKPRMVVVYAGDNDLAEGHTPQAVLESFVSLVEGVHRALPDTRIAYVSIKPSPLRASLLPSVREANALIAAYVAKSPKLDFIDVYARMIDADGRPRADLYGDDALHLNRAGYALWGSLIGPRLQVAGRGDVVAVPVAGAVTPP